MASFVETNRQEYLSKYTLKEEYNHKLLGQVIEALAGVLEEEQASVLERSQLTGILSGHTGKIQLSEVAVKTLFEANLLHGSVSSTGQPDDPGWRHLDEKATREHGGRPFRYDSYFVALPEVPKGYSLSGVGVHLEAENTQYYTKDFTRWVLRRD